MWDDALLTGIQHTLKFERLDVIAVGGAKETIPSDDMYNKFIYMIELMIIRILGSTDVHVLFIKGPM